MKNIFSTLLITIFSFAIINQGFSNNPNDKIWELLLNNNREEALKLVNKFRKDLTVEQLVLKAIVQNENGISKIDDNFYSDFTSKKDFDMFLFPLWNERFIFKEYLNSNFDKEIIDRVNIFSKSNISDSTVKAALLYLEALCKMNKNDFDGYYKELKLLKAVSSWQYCGVFENLNDSGMDKVYPPENNPVSTEMFNANSNGMINWFTPNPESINAYQYMANYSEFGKGINYAQTFFRLEEDQEIIFKLGISSKTKLWLNDILIFEEFENHSSEIDAHSIKIMVPKGNNRILIKTTNNGKTNFLLRVFDGEGNLLDPNDLNFTSAYNTYNLSTSEDLKISLLPNRIEEFFINLDNSQYSQFFKDYLLINTYLRNSKGEKAKKIILSYLEKYPKCSFMRTHLMQCYSIDNDYTQINEITENRKNDDPDYYLSLINEFANPNKLLGLPINEMNKKIDKIINSTDLEIVKLTGELFKVSRSNDKEEMKIAVDKLMNKSRELESSRLMTIYSRIYSSMFNEDEKTLELLTEIEDNYFYYSAHKSLIRRYDKLNNQKKVLELDKDFIDKLHGNLEQIKNIISDMHMYNMFEESMNYIDQGLELFPFSFIMMRYKGDALVQLKKEKEALIWYKKSYEHDSANSSLRKKIRDLENEDDPMNKIILKEPYKFIKKNRGKNTNSSYDLNVLLDEKNIQIFKVGGYKTHTTYIYEITSDEGIKLLKEYDLNLSYGYTINKSETVKPDGRVVPAEKSGSKFVFNSLSIGDVIYIDFEVSYNNSGRFYKDFTDYYDFDFYYPNNNVSYRIIIPKSKKIYYSVTNGELKFKKHTEGKYHIYEWTKDNPIILPPYEPYMPQDIDVSTVLHISTIENWAIISNWYSDLVKNQIDYDQIVINLFNELFPNGYSDMSEKERAKVIYDYIINNLTYSFVDFKQSGFVPQKPSKTIKTLMGDCKDFSTLFLILADKAEISTNLVLVSTSDLGEKALLLPTTDFNHCIVVTELDGQQQFLELTDKNLSFESLPNTLESALGLIIPFDSSDENKSNLFKLENLNKNKTIYKSKIDIIISDDSQKASIKMTSTGKMNSYFRDLLNEKNEQNLEKNLESYFERSDGVDISISSYNIDLNRKEIDTVMFTADLIINNEIKKLGKSKIIQLPKFSNPYTSDIVSLDTRVYPIIYRWYENVDLYDVTYSIKLEDEQKFTEIPDDIKLDFKNHHFTISWKLEEDSILKVHIYAEIGKEDISPEEYIEYRSFVRKVLEALDSYFSFS